MENLPSQLRSVPARISATGSLGGSMHTQMAHKKRHVWRANARERPGTRNTMPLHHQRRFAEELETKTKEARTQKKSICRLIHLLKCYVTERHWPWQRVKNVLHILYVMHQNEGDRHSRFLQKWELRDKRQRERGKAERKKREQREKEEKEESSSALQPNHRSHYSTQFHDQTDRQEVNLSEDDSKLISFPD